jgi:hypothetical protein
MFRFVGRFRTAVHPHALSAPERASGDLALSRYRTEGELYPASRGRKVNMLV